MILLTLNVGLFAGVGTFAFWIRSGVAFAPTMDGYWDQMGETFRFTGEHGVSLASLLVEPISVEEVPMQVPILGLLLATLIGIPILVAILYRFWASLPFIAVVGFLAVMPWLAITLLGSCVIASARPFRTSIRFVSALLGLLPAMVYLALASAGTAQVVAGRIDPGDAIKFMAPWFLAVVASAALFALVLAIAKLVDYRTGAITPLLAAMFAGPVVLFEFYVGRDELHYRLFEAFHMAQFEEVNTRAEPADAAMRAWERHPLPRPRRQKLYEQETQKWQMALAADLEPFQHELADHQEALLKRCAAFERAFPESRYVFNVCYLRACALDTRIDVEEFRRTGWIRFYDDFPSVRSRSSWRLLWENRPSAVLSAAAGLRLAMQEARDGEIDRAIRRCHELLESFDGGIPREEPSAGPSSLPAALARRAPEAGLNIDLDRILFKLRCLKELCENNRDAKYGDDPLCGPLSPGSDLWYGLLDLDSRDPRYAANVKRLMERYPGCRLADNLLLEQAKSSKIASEQEQGLESCVRANPQGDAADEALVRLAMLFQSTGRGQEVDELLGRISRNQVGSAWARRAWHLFPDRRLTAH